MLAKADANLQARRQGEPSDGRGGAVAVYDLPLPKKRRLSAEEKAGPRRREDRGSAYSRPAAADHLLPYARTSSACPDNLAVVRGILGRLAHGGQAGSLAEAAAYQKVMQRCAADAAGKTPQVRWFVYPLGYAEALRAATPPENRRQGKTFVEVMRHQGFGAIQGVGGYLDFAAEGYQVVHRTAVYAPPPYQKSMKMAVLPNHADFTAQPWVPRDIATYTTFYLDILNAFDNFGSHLRRSRRRAGRLEGHAQRNGKGPQRPPDRT